CSRSTATRTSSGAPPRPAPPDTTRGLHGLPHRFTSSFTLLFVVSLIGGVCVCAKGITKWDLLLFELIISFLRDAPISNFLNCSPVPEILLLLSKTAPSAEFQFQRRLSKIGMGCNVSSIHRTKKNIPLFFFVVEIQEKKYYFGPVYTTNVSTEKW